jgi:hypothetical protein
MHGYLNLDVDMDRYIKLHIIKAYTPADMNADICMGMYANIYIDTSADKDMNFFPYVDMTWKFHVRLNLLHREHRHEPLHEYLYLPG